jgi:hypothetical protein
VLPLAQLEAIKYLFFGASIWVLVRMMLHSKFPVALLQLCLCGIWAALEDVYRTVEDETVSFLSMMSKWLSLLPYKRVSFTILIKERRYARWQ